MASLLNRMYCYNAFSLYYNTYINAARSKCTKMTPYLLINHLLISNVRCY